ncbi:hypothetical protein [Parahaliea mediterranea]|uniref:Uncharacterized protein n=1 Tax=Parahaliea mediterranea TaxID=651086 RepID=A0A939DDH5_9GAMM|nr:hypothetical protein [Parahaliea mediterranea]MBN7796161.1 hypothetical protein [Parahaliea mediterranea]
MYLHTDKPALRRPGNALLTGGLLFLASSLISVAGGGMAALTTFAVLGATVALLRPDGRGSRRGTDIVPG